MNLVESHNVFNRPVPTAEFAVRESFDPRYNYPEWYRNYPGREFPPLNDLVPNTAISLSDSRAPYTETLNSTVEGSASWLIHHKVPPQPQGEIVTSIHAFARQRGIPRKGLDALLLNLSELDENAATVTDVIWYQDTSRRHGEGLQADVDAAVAEFARQSGLNEVHPSPFTRASRVGVVMGRNADQYEGKEHYTEAQLLEIMASLTTTPLVRVAASGTLISTGPEFESPYTEPASWLTAKAPRRDAQPETKLARYKKIATEIGAIANALGEQHRFTIHTPETPETSPYFGMHTYARTA